MMMTARHKILLSLIFIIFDIIINFVCIVYFSSSYLRGKPVTISRVTFDLIGYPIINCTVTIPVSCKRLFLTAVLPSRRRYLKRIFRLNLLFSSFFPLLFFINTKGLSGIRFRVLSRMRKEGIFEGSLRQILGNRLGH